MSQGAGTACGKCGSPEHASLLPLELQGQSGLVSQAPFWCVLPAWAQSPPKSWGLRAEVGCGSPGVRGASDAELAWWRLALPVGSV